PHKSRTLGQTEQLVWPRRSQPLEINWQLRGVEVLAGLWLWRGLRGNPRRFSFDRWKTIAGKGPKPSVFSPDHLLNRGLPPERASSSVGQRPAAQVHHVGAAVGSVDEIRMAGALQRGVRTMTCAQHVYVGMQLVGTVNLFSARHRHRVAPAGSSFGGNQMVVHAALVQVRT